MNANELADFLDIYYRCNQPASNALCEAATMLRKQETLINELFKYKESYENNEKFWSGYGHN